MKIEVCGIGSRGDGYPNAEQTIALLQRQNDFDVSIRCAWLPLDIHLWKLAKMSLWRSFGWLLWIVVGNLQSLLGVLMHMRTRKETVVYVPYPAIFFLFWLSLVPRSCRPQVFADTYISIWDSMFRDRNAVLRPSMLSRCLRALEARCLQAADRVLVDTEANVRQMIADFHLDPARVISLPLAIDEAPFLAVAPYVALPNRRVRVLFVGTMIPLHGIDVLLGAMNALRDDDRVEFHLIGDGQLGDQVDAMMRGYDPERARWIRSWQGLDVIANEIARSDICLGVFGGTGKASRVLPFKLYMYFAAGRPVISQAALSLPKGAPQPPMSAVANCDADGLAAAIIELVEDPSRRTDLGSAARGYYENWLSNARVASAWQKLTDGERVGADSIGSTF